ncbi:MAG: T9SS type A sorting domain-containing protein, partial [Cytophagaceae bacterium]|nr:T9SS type A sorting domain-containing protein [Cytophagaceae bacterium]
AGTHTLTCTPSNTCGSGPARTLNVLVNDVPSKPGAFTTSSATVIQGQSGVVYTVPSVAGETYNWTYGGTGGTINNNGSNSITVDFSASATSGTLSVTASNSCGSSASPRTISITVNTSGSQTPQPGNFTQSTNPVTQGQTGVTYSIPNVPATTYTWSYTGTGGTIIGTGATITMDFGPTATSGTLQVIADDGSGPSAPRQLAITVNPLTATFDAVAASLKIYPNPFESYSVIEFSLVSNAEVNLEVCDLTGHVIMSLIDDENMSAGNHALALSGLPEGMYIVKLKVGGREKNIKVIKN